MHPFPVIAAVSVPESILTVLDSLQWLGPQKRARLMLVAAHSRELRSETPLGRARMDDASLIASLFSAINAKLPPRIYGEFPEQCGQ